MLLEDIKNNWKTDILGYAQVISSLKDTKYPAHTVKLVDGYGVAIPYSGDDVNESFSNVRIFSTDNIMASPGVIQRSLTLLKPNNPSLHFARNLLIQALMAVQELLF